MNTARKTVRRILTTAIALALMAMSIPAFGEGGVTITEGYYTVAWEKTSLPDQFPQTLVLWTGPTDGPQLDALDGALAESDACGEFQIDVYKVDSERDIAKLTNLLTKGTLELNDKGIPEDSAIYHSSKHTEKECQTTTTTEGTTTTTEGTTSTTEEETTTTTVESTTSTSTIGSSTTTTGEMTSSTATTPTTVTSSTGSTLPFTGDSTGDFTLAGFGLLLMGVLVLVVGWKVDDGATG